MKVKILFEIEVDALQEQRLKDWYLQIERIDEAYLNIVKSVILASVITEHTIRNE